jgi:hypothetical protein
MKSSKQYAENNDHIRTNRTNISQKKGRCLSAPCSEQTFQMKKIIDKYHIHKQSVNTVQRIPELEEEPLQGKAIQKQENKTGMPDSVKSKMETSFNTDFSDVRIHRNSSKAPQVGALAYTQGTDIHFAPGQFTPDSRSGRQILGHELTHVIQHSQGRVQPTTEIAGMPVNDDRSLEEVADRRGSEAAF